MIVMDEKKCGEGKQLIIYVEEKKKMRGTKK